MFAYTHTRTHTYTNAHTHVGEISLLVITPLIALQQREPAYKLYNKAYYGGR